MAHGGPLNAGVEKLPVVVSESHPEATLAGAPATLVPGSYHRAVLTKRVALAASPERTAILQMLAEVRRRAALTQAEVGKRMGITDEMVNRNLRGARPSSWVSFGWVVRFVVACGGRILVELPNEPR